jgi:hypothetical protein
LLYPGKSKGLRAAFPLFCGFIAVLICVALFPQSVLDRLYRMTGQDPGAGDRVFLRLVIGILIAWMVWQAIQIRRKLHVLTNLEPGNRKH